jgi:MtN3 and saliva related transmembrane protein
MTPLHILVLIFGSLMGAANLPQAMRIFERKSAGDISVITYSILFIGVIFWILYGFEINDIAIIVANMIGFVGISMVLVGWFLYHEKPKKTRKKSK